MTKVTTPSYDLVEIEIRARQMRAAMIAEMFRATAAWFRKQRQTGAVVQGRTA